MGSLQAQGCPRLPAKWQELERSLEQTLPPASGNHLPTPGAPASGPWTGRGHILSCRATQLAGLCHSSLRTCQQSENGASCIWARS